MENDIRVPIIFSTFSLFVLVGGILLVIYVFIPHFSQSWFPYAALLLISSPWILWLFIYIYTGLKLCCLRRSTRLRINTRVASQGTNRGPSPPAMQDLATDIPREDSPGNSPDDGKKVHFGAVVVIDNDNEKGLSKDEGKLGSAASFDGSEKPLASR